MGGLLPIPVEQAVFDFVELGPGKPKGGGAETTQVLLVVAQREIVIDHREVVTPCGLKVRAVRLLTARFAAAYPQADGAPRRSSRWGLNWRSSRYVKGRCRGSCAR